MPIVRREAGGGDEEALRAALVALEERRIRTPDELVDVLEVLETSGISDVQALVQPTCLTLAVATELGLDGLVMRARLAQSEIDRRLGCYEASVDAVRSVLEWAEHHDDDFLRARSHRAWATHLRAAGDIASAVEHAVLGVQYLPDDVAPRTRALHMIGLAIAIGESGSSEESIRLFADVLSAAVEGQDWWLAALVLNNLAYAEYRRSNVDAATDLTNQMIEIEQVHHLPLDGAELDTIARVQLLCGRPEEAEQTLRPMIGAVCDVTCNESISLAEGLLTLTEARRQLKRVELAQASLDRAKTVCEEHHLAGQAVRVRLAQAELYADAGRFREAYEEQLRFNLESEALRSAQREQRAALMEMILGVQQARRDSAYFKQLATVDPLTGLHNRRWLEDELDRCLKRASPSTPVSVALVDIDHFKWINDSHSHAAGDEVLVEVASTLNEVSSAPATVGRLGGDEFLVVMSDHGERSAEILAEQLRAAVGSISWAATLAGAQVTVTIGTTTVTDARADRSTVLARADRNLYVGKRRGRNCVTSDRLVPAGFGADGGRPAKII